jgi:acetolactate synthase-1/3 small subunit
VAIIKNSAGFHEKLREFEESEPHEEKRQNQYLDKSDSVFAM